MTPAAIMQTLKSEGVDLTLSPSGSIKAKGPGEVVKRWAETLKANKAALINELRANDNNADDAPEPDIETPIRDPAFWQGVADQRNAAAVRRHGTDRYCQCQKLAENEWFDPTFKRRVWICDECLPIRRA